MPKNTKRGHRKDRVLQDRIPEQLDEELRGRADRLGLSVSTIVRNVLLHTFDLVEGVVTDSAQIARAIHGQEPPADSSETETAQSVIGWQEVVLNRNGVCEQCNCILPRGDRAAVGVPAGARPLLLCLSCLDSVAAPAIEKPKEDSS